jgi:hypothetical protein
MMRFRQCMTRGMTYIKMYIIKTLREIGYDIYKASPAKVIGKFLRNDVNSISLLNYLRG